MKGTTNVRWVMHPKDIMNGLGYVVRHNAKVQSAGRADDRRITHCTAGGHAPRRHTDRPSCGAGADPSGLAAVKSVASVVS